MSIYKYDEREPVYLSQEILKIAEKGDLEQVKAVLEHHPEYLNARAEGHNRTLLWTAVRRNRPAIVYFLVEHGADINARMSDGATPLAVAMKAKRMAATERIRHYGGER